MISAFFQFKVGSILNLSTISFEKSLKPFVASLVGKVVKIASVNETSFTIVLFNNGAPL